MTLHLLRIRDVAARIAYSESKVYAMIRKGDFPRGRKMPMGGVRIGLTDPGIYLFRRPAESEEASQ